MSGQAWYPHYARDFIDGVQGLGPDTIGAYIVLLDLMYSRGGPIQEDSRHLSGILGCSTRLASSLIQRLIDAKKISRDGDLLVNSKASQVIENAAKRSRKLSEAGANGGRTAAQKKAEVKENSDLAQARFKHTTTEDIIKKEESAVVDADASKREPFVDETDEAINGKIDLNQFAANCAESGGVNLISPGHIAAAVELVKAWLALGVDRAFILKNIREGVVAATEPISSLRYFDRRIRTETAKRKAIENGQPPAPRNAKPPKAIDALTQGALDRMAARRAADQAGGVELLGRAEQWLLHE